MAADDRATIEKLVPGGAGLFRLRDGRVGFARGVFPGEQIRILRARERKGIVEADEVSLLAPAPERIEPPCPIAAACGGCDWMALDVDAQRAHKREVLAQALARTGKFRALPEIELRHAGPALGYRNRLRLQVGPRGVLGFFAHHSRELVEVHDCLVAEPRLRAALGELRRLVRGHETALRAFASVEIRVAEVEPARVLRLVPADGADFSSGTVRALLGAIGGAFALSVAGQAGDVEQALPLPLGLTLRVPASAFTQVNCAVNTALVEAVVEGAGRRGVTSFIDLYGGAGNFTLPLLKAGASGVLVEGHAGAVAAARRSAAEQGLAGEFRAGDVATALELALRRGERYDLALLDPPRSGAREAIASLAELGPAHVAYVACDPVTLARDLRDLAARGYEIEALSVFDMFPQTHHFETLAWLRRSFGPGPRGAGR